MSRAWQREMAESVIAGCGVITGEFFNVGCSRRVPWVRRPRAAALLEQAQGPSRGFDAVVVGGSSGRSPTVSSMRSPHCWPYTAWLPETGGPVELADPNHRVLMQVLAAQSQREVVRSRHRTLAAMTAQTIEQGRFLGGRPPYGYRLVDAGPHPNRAHAAWGRRRQRLDPDPVTARHARWIFAERLARRSVAGFVRRQGRIVVTCRYESS